MDTPKGIDTVVTAVAPYNIPKIRPGDILSLSVIPIDQLGSIYQTPVSGTVAYSTQTAQLSQPPNGSTYAIDKSGDIEAPLVGRVKLIDLSVDEAKETLRSKYAIFYKSFSINLAFVNHKFTILGEVSHPGSFTIQSDQVSIFDALGLAGDITVYGKKDNVLLVRDSAENKKRIVRLNLNSGNIIKSPYYYLKENDLVYVEPSRAKLASTDAYRTRNLAILATLVSFSLAVLFRTKIL